MAKNINLQNINPETLAILSGFYHDTVKGQTIRKDAKAPLVKAQEALDAKKAERQALVDNGATWNEAINAISILEETEAVARAEEDYKSTCTEIRVRCAKATALVPDSLYDAYKGRKTDRDAYISALSEFLAELGLCGTERGVEKVGDGIYEYLVGSAKATGKTLAAGHLLKDWTKTTFKDMVVRAFIEFGVYTKKAFDVDEEFNLSLHNFEEEGE